MQQSSSLLTEEKAAERLATIALTKHGYHLQCKLGSGGCAMVYLARSIKYNSDFAIKQIRPRRNFRLECALSELRTLMSLSHPNIIQIFDYFIESSNLYLVFEYCPGGSIQDLIEIDGSVPECNLIRYSRQIIEAMSFCQSQNIAHHDIKPGNILLDSYDRPKLADFGLSFKWELGSSSTNELNFDGSLQFMAPELISRINYDPFEADIWSLGVTFYMMVVGKSPWRECSSKEELQSVIMNGEVECYPPMMKKKFASLIASMLQVDVSKRATMETLRKSFIFNKKHDNCIKNYSSTNLFLLSSRSQPTNLNDPNRLSKLRLVSANQSEDEEAEKSEVKSNLSLLQFPRAFKHTLRSEMNIKDKIKRRVNWRTFSNIETFAECEQ